MSKSRSIRHVLWSILCLCIWTFATPTYAADAVKSQAAVSKVTKKSAADVAMGKKCLSCHGPGDDPGIYGEWKKSTHASKNVDCYD
jgi:hypothetical protein